MSHVRNIDEIRAEVRKMAGKSKIFRRAKIEDVESVLGNLTSKDPELWAAEWSRVAKPYEEAGGKHEKSRRFEEPAPPIFRLTSITPRADIPCLIVPVR